MEKMLEDKHLKVQFYELKSGKVFAGTDIKGGVAITYRGCWIKIWDQSAYLLFLNLK